MWKKLATPNTLHERRILTWCNKLDLKDVLVRLVSLGFYLLFSTCEKWEKYWHTNRKCSSCVQCITDTKTGASTTVCNKREAQVMPSTESTLPPITSSLNAYTHTFQPAKHSSPAQPKQFKFLWMMGFHTFANRSRVMCSGDINSKTMRWRG